MKNISAILFLSFSFLFSAECTIHGVEGVVNYSDVDIGVVDGAYTWTDVDIGYAIPTASWTDIDIALTDDKKKADLVILNDFKGSDLTVALAYGAYTWTDIDVAVVNGAYTWTDIDIGFSYSAKPYTDYTVYVENKDLDVKSIIALFYYCFKENVAFR